MRPDHALNPLAEIDELLSRNDELRAEVEGYRNTAQNLARAVTALQDENAELRAALTDWARADRTASEAHKTWLSEAAKGGASYTGDKVLSPGQKRWAESLPSFHAWVQARADGHIAKERLQELARAALAATEGEA